MALVFGEPRTLWSDAATLSGLATHCLTYTQGSSRLATLGSVMESLWDSPLSGARCGYGKAPRRGSRFARVVVHPERFDSLLDGSRFSLSLGERAGGRENGTSFQGIFLVRF